MVDLIHERDDAMAEAELLLERSRAITLNGRDKRGRAVVRIVGKYFPARALGGRAEAELRGYVRRRVLPEIGEREFVVVYVHSLVDRGDNFPGVAAIRAAYEALPAAAKERLRAVYFVHPGFQARLFFATLGRFLFSSGLYEKLRYMSRLEYLWEHVSKGEMEVPECARQHDEELERRPLMDYGIEATDRRCMFDAASMDTSASLHSLRCIS
uniref:CRAL-TRIO domain-containing protein n=2 Tax=Oryza TaxID=4527 RepID=A0A0E0GAY3_ORYNI